MAERPPRLAPWRPAAAAARPPAGPGERFVAWALAVAAGGLALLISWYVLDLVPHVTDAVAYLFQGRILAAGHFSLPPPPVAPLFAHENVVLTATRWCAPYPPGWPLLLALGWLLGAPWLVNPLLLGLAVLGVWAAGRQLYDPVTGLVAAAALACSPFALLMAGDAMAHVAALCASVWCLAALAAAARHRPPVAGPSSDDTRRFALRCAAAGLLGAFAFLIRPVTALALLTPAVAWWVLVLPGRRRLGRIRAVGAVGAVRAMGAPGGSGGMAAVGAMEGGGLGVMPGMGRWNQHQRAKDAHLAGMGGVGRLAGLGWAALGAAPALAFMAIYDRALFGGALTLGYKITDAHIARGAAGAVAPLATALLHTLPWYLGRLNESLWGLPWGDLLLVLPLLAARRHRAADAMLAAAAAALVLVHSFYYYGDILYSGPRLAFETLGPLSLLAARSLLTLRAWLAAGLEKLRPLLAANSRHPAGAARPSELTGATRTELPGAARSDPTGAGKSELIGAARPDLIDAVRPDPIDAARLDRLDRFDPIAALRLGLTGAALGLLLYYPLGRRLPAQVVHESQWYLAVSAIPLREAAVAGVGPRALVFVAGTPWCYSAFFPANGLHPATAPRVYVRDIPPLRAAALRAYPRPETWIAWVEVTIPDPRRDPDIARPTRLTWQRLR